MAARLVESPAAVAATPAPAPRVAPPALLACETRYEASVQAGLEAHSALVPPAAGAAKKRGRPKPSPPVPLLLRLRAFKGQGLACMADFRVPFDHNQGERAIRMAKVTQQVSGGFCTLEGAQRCGRMRGYLSPARKHAKMSLRPSRMPLRGRRSSLPQTCSKGR
jgi:Transposase IS66 family